nr:hypothetical protein [Crenothrix polyspora]
MGDYRYLLDTNIVSELVKNPQGRLAEKMLTSGWEKYSCTSIIVACEYVTVRLKSNHRSSRLMSSKFSQAYRYCLFKILRTLPTQSSEPIWSGEVCPSVAMIY